MTFTVTPASPHRKKFQRGPGGNRRNSSQSEPSSEADSAVDSPLSEPLNVDVSCMLMSSSSIGDDNRSSATWRSYRLFRKCSLVRYHLQRFKSCVMMTCFVVGCAVPDILGGHSAPSSGSSSQSDCLTLSITSDRAGVYSIAVVRTSPLCSPHCCCGNLTSVQHPSTLAEPHLCAAPVYSCRTSPLCSTHCCC